MQINVYPLNVKHQGTIQLFISLLLLAVFSPFLTISQVIDADMGVLEQSHLPGFVKEKKPEVGNPYARNYYLSEM